MNLPVDIDWKADRLDLESPYYECGICKYVGKEIHPRGQCPQCNNRNKGTATPWPNNQWFSAVEDIVFLYNNRKLELSTIAAAGYFEGCLHDFLFKALYLVWEATRWKPRVRPNEKEVSLEQHDQDMKEYERCLQVITEIFEKHRGRWNRETKLCTRVFGEAYDELLKKLIPDCKGFILNRNSIHKARNQLLHAGFPMTEVWEEDVKRLALRACVEFMVQCWEVFRALQNELICKPLLCRAPPNTPP